jgi:peptidoglycan/xylan/chitin deacetylase (PgdA/CDA1 family)
MNFFNKITNKVESLKNDIKFCTNQSYSKIINKNDSFIIMYHGVSLTKNNLFNARHTYYKDFEKQIKYLSKNANIISVNDFFAKNFKENTCNIAITFDDGYKNNLEVAAPILKKYNVPASMYITGLNKEEKHRYIWADFAQIAAYSTNKKLSLNNELFEKKNNQYFRNSDSKNLLEIIKNESPEYSFKLELYQQLNDEFISVKDEFSELWELMSDEDLKELLKYENITIGSHGLLHNNLGNIKFDNAKTELINSKYFLEQLLQKEINEVAYPDGSYSKELVEFAAVIGFTKQLAAEGFRNPEDACNNLLRDRLGIYQCKSWGNQLIFE